MRPLRLLGLFALAALVGCAEGGVTGTGISSVSGNVAQVSQTAVAAALPFPIRITVAELPSATAVTDADGAFTVRGAFSGAITLQFANAADGSPIGPLALEVPAGSSTLLENIEIRTAAPLPERVRPRAVRQLDVFGRLDMVECAADGSGTLLVSDDGRPPRQYLATLTADTVLRGRDGTAITCADLSAVHRPTVRVEGLVRLADQTIVATLVEVTGARPPHPPDDAERPERLHGVVTAVACARGVLEVAQAAGPEPAIRVVHLDADTEVRCAGTPPTPCSCADIGLGDAVAVRGDIVPGRPGIVAATRVTIGSDSAI